MRAGAALCGRDATGESSWLVREARAMIESIDRSIGRSVAALYGRRERARDDDDDDDDDG